VLAAVLCAVCLLIISHFGDPTATAPQSAEPAPVTAPAPTVRFTVLYDNTPNPRSDLRPDWGFACLVEGLERTVLFDTGAKGDILLGNMRILGMDPDDIDTIVLSHQHSDHVGGLASFLAENPDVVVYHPAGFPKGLLDQARAAGATLVPVAAAETICPGATVTAPMGDSPSEMGLVVDTSQGAVLITGCAHPGIVPMTRAAAELAGGSVHTVFGGFHLLRQSHGQIEEVIEGLWRVGVRRCGPAHCTGESAVAQMREAFGEGFIQMGTGATAEF